MKIYKAISEVQKELAETGIAKNKKNTMQGYQFRGIDDVYNALASLLPKHNLVILPRIIGCNQVERINQKGTALFYTTVEAEFDFVHTEDFSKHTVKTFGEAMDSADKSTNKAMSTAYKYACFQAFCIPTEGDNDTENSHHEIVPVKKTPLDEQTVKECVDLIKLSVTLDQLKSAHAFCYKKAYGQDDAKAIKLFDSVKDEMKKQLEDKTQ